MGRVFTVSVNAGLGAVFESLGRDSFGACFASASLVTGFCECALVNDTRPSKIARAMLFA